MDMNATTAIVVFSKSIALRPLDARHFKLWFLPLSSVISQC